MVLGINPKALCTLALRCIPSSNQEVVPFNSNLIPKAFLLLLERGFYPN